MSNLLRNAGATAFLCFVWLLPGLFGHDPWKADEPYSFGMVHHIITTGDWVVPTVAGEPFIEKPPIFYLTASVLAKLVYPLLPLHDGARLACAVFMVITFAFTALASRELYGKGSGRIAVLILMGCIGLVNHAHKLMTDISLLSGFAVGLYGLILSRRRWFIGGLLTGTGVGIGFMSKGLLAPGLMGIIALVLPFWCKEWMNKAYLFSLFIALFSAVPWFFVWPYALYQQAPHLFREWFWVQNFGRFFGYAHQGPPNEPGYYLMHLPYFAWPAVPLALLAFWRHWRSGGGIPLRTFPFTAFIVMLGILSLASDARVLYALPMLLPLTLLAVPGVQALTPATIRIANQCNAYCFGFMALVLWLGWLVLQSGYPPFIMEKLHAESPAHISALHPVYLTAAFLITLLWLVVITSYKKSGEGVVFRWTTGVTLLWTLMMTLWLPFVDDARSYRAMVLDLKKALPSSSERIAGKHLGESERAMLEYFGGIRTEKVGDIQSAKNNCNLLLIGTCRGTANNDIGSDWKKIWEGNRPGHKKELFVLYQQVAAQGNSGRTAQHQAYDGAIQAALPGMELHHH